MPEETLRLRRAAFHALLSGQPVSLHRAAAAANLSPEKADEAAQLVASVGMAEINGGTIFGIDGLTTRETRHQVVLNGVALWTWCAYDIVGITAALGANANGTTGCGLCGRRIEVVLRAGEPEPSPAVGWLPDESCSNVMAEFCPSALLFCSRTHLAEWRQMQTGVTSGQALDVASLAARGRADWRPLVTAQPE